MALVVRKDTPENKDSSSLPKAESIVLDVLPYVESLDPDYEQYAISLIEDELQQTLPEQKRHTGAETEEHPSLRRLLPFSASVASSNLEKTPDLGGKAPIAASAYESLVARQQNSGDIIPDDSDWMARPDPIADRGGKIEEGDDKEVILSELQTSLATSKVKFEQERMRLINLELYQQLETAQRWKDYHSELEQRYATPMTDAVAQQRLRVDGINAGRMEEQELAARKLRGLNNRWDQLVEKNQRLNNALSGLESDVQSLRETAEVDMVDGGA